MANFPMRPISLAHAAATAISLQLSLLLKRPIVWGRPIVLMLEPVSRCNLQCPLCPIGARTLTRPLGEMSLENFTQILDNVGPQLWELALWNQGEPTLNDKLPEMIRVAHDRGIYTLTSTNGNLLLQRNLIDRLIESGLDELIFSLDGLTQETYEIYRIGGKLNLVIEAMQTLRRRRTELGRKNPRIVMQWLPMKHNEHEIPLLRNKAAEWGADKIEIKTAQIYSEDQFGKFLPEMETLRRYEKRGQRWETKRRYQSCRRLWFSAMIDWNGTVVPCCFDKNEEFVVGNALMEDFGEIWRGEGFQKFRKLLLAKGRVLDICRNCTEGLKSCYISLNKLEKSAAHKGTARLEKTPL